MGKRIIAKGMGSGHVMTGLVISALVHVFLCCQAEVPHLSLSDLPTLRRCKYKCTMPYPSFQTLLSVKHLSEVCGGCLEHFCSHHNSAVLDYVMWLRSIATYLKMSKSLSCSADAVLRSSFNEWL